ncbi:MAG: aldo/keto reductase [Sulfuricurvum sp.]|nr:aldo/keto reductase [Sulfuricurvum sp.]
MISSATINANTKMPPLMYGTAWKKEHTSNLVEMAISSGFRGIDTACQPKHYNEAGVGEALARLKVQGITREELFIQTKFTPLSGQDPARIPYDPNASLDIQVAQSFSTSQKNLRTEYVDSLVLHSPLFPYVNLLKVWRAMEVVHQCHGAHQIGISNCYDLDLLQKLYNDAEVKPAVVQNRFYAESGYDVEIRQWCNDVGIIYQSFWSLTANPHILESEIVCAIARKYVKTQAQIFYRFISHNGIIPLIGSTSKHHIDEDLAIFTFQLDIDEIAAISSLLEP